MNTIRHIASAAIVAAAASLGAAGAAQALPAGAANFAPPAVEFDATATPVYHRHRRCWPVYRWVWTHWGWRYRYVGTHCARPRYHPYWY